MAAKWSTGRWARRGAILLALAVLAWANPAMADGGRLRFRRQAGPFIVTLFTTPDPLAKGRADFSVAVERTGQPGLVEDAHIDLILTPAEGGGRRMVLHATRAAATSKWLEAANFSLPSAGVWRVTVVVRRGDERGECSGEVRVRAERTPNLIWDVLPVPLFGLFWLAHLDRKRRYRRERLRRAEAAAGRG